jgi:hypothetical protein
MSGPFQAQPRDHRRRGAEPKRLPLGLAARVPAFRGPRGARPTLNRRNPWSP